MRVLAIASAGGHWIQLLRLKPAFENYELIFASTKKSFADTVQGHEFYTVPDVNRRNKLKLISVAYQIFKLVSAIKPDVIITTGAAPGLLALLAGKITGAKTIWVDSIANVETLSMSGKLAQRFVDRIYTQWPDLADGKITFKGNVLS